MGFKDTYTSTEKKEKDKKIISNDAYALGDAIQELANTIERLRLSIR